MGSGRVGGAVPVPSNVRRSRNSVNYPDIRNDILNLKSTHRPPPTTHITHHSYQLRPVKRPPYFFEPLPLGCRLLLTELHRRLHPMCLHVEGSRHHFVAEISLPESLVLYGVRVAVTETEIDVEVFDLFGDLSLQAAFLFLDLDDAFVGAPVALHVC